jgi:hypothetical protein
MRKSHERPQFSGRQLVNSMVLAIHVVLPSPRRAHISMPVYCEDLVTHSYPAWQILAARPSMWMSLRTAVLRGREA